MGKAVCGESAVAAQPATRTVPSKYHSMRSNAPKVGEAACARSIGPAASARAAKSTTSALIPIVRFIFFSLLWSVCTVLNPVVTAAALACRSAGARAHALLPVLRLLSFRGVELLWARPVHMRCPIALGVTGVPSSPPRCGRSTPLPYC